MGKSFDTSGLKKLRDNLQKEFSEQKSQQFMEDCTNKLAKEFIEKVKDRTPVGDYSGNSYVCNPSATGRSHKGSKVNGKRGGTLLHSWEIGEVKKNGNVYTVEVINNAKNDKGVPYGSYVEYGHRTKNGGFTEGHFMMSFTKEEIESQNFVQKIADKLFEAKFKKVFGDLK